MVNTLEVIERSIYDAILQVAIKEGLTLDPKNYYPVTPESIKQFNDDKKALSKYVSIFGAGSAESKGEKITPRIVVENDTLFPGAIGLQDNFLEFNEEDKNYIPIQMPSKSLEQIVNIHICAGNQADYRVLQTIVAKALPLRGYIKNYLNETLTESGNIFLELVNAYDESDTLSGLIEKAFQYQIQDFVLEELVIKDTENTENTIPMISDITFLTENQTLITINKTN